MALAAGDAVEQWLGDAGRTHLEHVMPMIEALFERRGLRAQDCDAFAFASGPGSFTGLRIACTIVQGLALGTARPVIAVGSLEALVQAAAEPQRPREPRAARRALAALDARMGQAYWAVFEETDGRWTPAGAPALCPASELPTLAALWRPHFVAGPMPWIGLHVDALAYRLRAATVGAASVARLARERFARGELLEPREAMPTYVRDHVAQTVEERLRARAGMPT